jgi:hypothetical protein
MDFPVMPLFLLSRGVYALLCVCVCVFLFGGHPFLLCSLLKVSDGQQQQYRLSKPHFRIQNNPSAP